MKELVVCKSCGFILDKAKLRDKCPACGVSAKMFLPYTDPVSAKRRFILSLDLHPVMVHFPQAFSAFLLLLSLASLIVSGEIHEKIVAAMHVIAAVLPFAVIGAFFAGILDGKIRFRRVNTPLLVRKMIVGGFFFLCSTGNALLLLASPVFTDQTAFISVLLSAASLGCATLLGLWGTSMLNARFPG